MKIKIAKTINDIEICYKLREIIFIKGQNVPKELERDTEDDTASHFLLLDDNDVPFGVGRVVADENTAVVGRIGIIKEYRQKGAGLFLMQKVIEYCTEQKFKKIILGAQEHALDFYKKLNFKIISEKYMDADIPHFKMQLEL